MPTDMMVGGRYSELIERAVRIPRDALRKSTLGHQEALEELASVWAECRHEDWDGFGALAVEPATFTAAYMLIDSLPLGFLRPSIGAEPDGHITLEWRRSPRRVLSVSVDPDGFLHYAGLFGSNKRFGTLAFFSTPPEELLQLAARVRLHSAAALDEEIRNIDSAGQRGPAIVPKGKPWRDGVRHQTQTLRRQILETHHDPRSSENPA